MTSELYAQNKTGRRPLDVPAPNATRMAADLSDEEIVLQPNDIVTDDGQFAAALAAMRHERELVPPDFGRSRLFLDWISNSVPTGSDRHPSVLLEIGGGQDPIPYSQSSMNSRKLIIGNIDAKPDWGNRTHQMDLNDLQNGLNSDQLSHLFEEASLGTVVMGHVVKFLNEDTFEDILLTGMERMLPGGRLIIRDYFSSITRQRQVEKMLEKHGHKRKDEGLDLYSMMGGRLMTARRSMRALAAAKPDEYRYAQYYLGAAFPRKFRDKVGMRKINSREIMKKPGVETTLHPFVDADADKQSFQIGRKFGCAATGEGVYVLEKIDTAKEKRLANELKNRRNALKRKAQDAKKRARKDKKRNRKR